jgi:hypothetical protein
MMESSNNPFRPAKRETYEQQLDLAAPVPSSKLVDDGTDLVDVGLAGSTTTTTTNTSEQKPKFLESSSSSLLPPNAGGPLGPSNTLLGSSSTGNTNHGATGSATAEGSSMIGSRLCGFLSVEYYRPYFDVSSATVLDRIKNGCSPHKADLFGGSADAPPDLYGAVWISLTLVFLIGATSNLNSYFAHDSSKEPWERDYRLLTFASTMVVAYTFAVPLLIWASSLYVGVDPRPSLTKMVGIYGYSMFNFIPASLLCVIPLGGVQWVVVLAAGALSGVVLLRNLWTLFGTRYTALPQDTESQTTLNGVGAQSGDAPARSKSAFLLLCGAAALHGVFSLLLKLFFFQGADFAEVVSEPTASPVSSGKSL